MKGHIRERSPGHWAIIVDVRDPLTGKRRRKWHSFRGGKRAAEVECARLIAENNAGLFFNLAKSLLLHSSIDGSTICARRSRLNRMSGTVIW